MSKYDMIIIVTIFLLLTCCMIMTLASILDENYLTSITIIGVIVSFYMMGATTINSNLIDDVAINKAIKQCKNNKDSSLLLKEIELIKIKHYKEKAKVSKYGIYFGIFLIYLMATITIKS